MKAREEIVQIVEAGGYAAYPALLLGERFNAVPRFVYLVAYGGELVRGGGIADSVYALFGFI